MELTKFSKMSWIFKKFKSRSADLITQPTHQIFKVEIAVCKSEFYKLKKHTKFEKLSLNVFRMLIAKTLYMNSWTNWPFWPHKSNLFWEGCISLLWFVKCTRVKFFRKVRLENFNLPVKNHNLLWSNGWTKRWIPCYNLLYYRTFN